VLLAGFLPVLDASMKDYGDIQYNLIAMEQWNGAGGGRWISPRPQSTGTFECSFSF
jgi:hypothetical protein